MGGLRLLFTGASVWTNSGYGKPGRFLFPRLARLGHKIGLCTFYGYQGQLTPIDVCGETIMMYPPAINPHFNDIIELHAAHFNADAVITFQDVWTLRKWGEKNIPWYPRTIIDTHPISQIVLDSIAGSVMPLAETKWGLRELRDNGWDNARWMPHGVDTALYAQRDKAESRRKAKLPETGFLAGMVAANASYPSRKNFPEVLLAWQRWIDGGGKGQLYIHATISHKGTDRSGGIDFETLLDTMHLKWATVDDPEHERVAEADVLFPAQHRYWVGKHSDDDLADVYNSLDVLLAPSAAEGFGIPLVEAQACEVPVVTLNVTAMPENTFGGVCIEPVQMQWEAEGGWRGACPVAELVDVIEQFATMPDDEHAAMGKAARAGAVYFDWDNLVENHWIPFFEEIAQ